MVKGVMLRSELDKRNLTVDDLACIIGKSKSTVYRKLSNLYFTVGEVRKIKEALNLSNERAGEIFLSE